MYYVYILFSEEKKLYYKGSTSDLQKRVEEHNSNKSHYTSNKGVWILVYSKQFETKKEALREELRLKKLNHASIEKLISICLDR